MLHLSMCKKKVLGLEFKAISKIAKQIVLYRQWKFPILPPAVATSPILIDVHRFRVRPFQILIPEWPYI